MFNLHYRYQEEAPADGDPAPADPTPADPVDPPQSNWPDNWRELYAGEDEGKVDQLSRYSSPSAAFDGLLAAKERIRSGQVGSPFPVDGSEDDQTAWRKSNNIPEEAKGYDLSFDDGLVIGDDDKPFIDKFLEVAHQTNQTPEQVKESLAWYYQNQEAQAEAQAEQDTQTRVETEDKLRLEWGPEYRPHLNAIQSFLDTMPEEIRENFASARMSDGTPILSNPNFLQWALNSALEINPATTLVSASGNQAESIADEIADIESKMGDRSSEYHKGPKAEALQARYRDLITARDKIKQAS